MFHENVECVVASMAGHWAKGKTIKVVKEKLNRNQPRGATIVTYFFVNAKPSAVNVIATSRGLMVCAPEGSTVLKLVERW